jgi:hypothetical protein
VAKAGVDKGAACAGRPTEHVVPLIQGGGTADGLDQPVAVIGRHRGGGADGLLDGGAGRRRIRKPADVEPQVVEHDAYGGYDRVTRQQRFDAAGNPT